MGAARGVDDGGGEEPMQRGAAPRARGTRRRWAVAIGVGVALLVGGVLVGVLANDRAAHEPATVTLPLPTPGLEPVERPADTALTRALPSTVLQWSLQASRTSNKWNGRGALVTYAEIYEELDGDPYEAIEVTVGQWRTADEAADFYEDEIARYQRNGLYERGSGADALPQDGTVEVDGKPVGDYLVLYVGATTGVAMWRNDTVVIAAVGPVDEMLDFYRAYPL